jgi:hypothetical protein
MIPLANDLLIRFREQMRREGLLAFASTPNWLLPFSRVQSVSLSFTNVERPQWRQCKKWFAVAIKPHIARLAAVML